MSSITENFRFRFQSVYELLNKPPSNFASDIFLFETFFYLLLALSHLIWYHQLSLLISDCVSVLPDIQMKTFFFYSAIFLVFDKKKWNEMPQMCWQSWTANTTISLENVAHTQKDSNRSACIDS